MSFLGDPFHWLSDHSGEHNRQVVAAAFKDVAHISPYDMANALATVTEILDDLPDENAEYVTRAMHEFRKAIAKPWEHEKEISDDAYDLYAAFRVALSWKSVVDAFNGLEARRDEQVEKFQKMMREIYPRSRKDDSDVFPHQEKRVSARDRVLIMDHVENIISIIIADLNRADIWKKEAKSLQQSLQRRCIFNFISSAINLFQQVRCGDDVVPLFNFVLSLRDQMYELPVEEPKQ